LPMTMSVLISGAGIVSIEPIVPSRAVDLLYLEA
jgi:hypothetical protein